MKFEGKQRFSLRKYSIGVASVLLGTFFVGANSSEQVAANELEASETGEVTLAPDPDVVVEVRETEASSTNTGVTSPVSSSDSVESESQETSQGLEVSPEASSTSHEQVATEEANDASQTWTQATGEATVSDSSEITETARLETEIEVVTPAEQPSQAASEEPSTALEQAGLLTESGDVTVAVNDLHRLFPPAGVEHLTNALNAALVERNRSGRAGSSGFRSAAFNNTTDLSLKISAVTARGLLNGYFVDMGYIENLKIGFEQSGIPWAYDFKVENPTYVNPNTRNIEPQVQYVAHVPLTRMGTIDFVDAEGNSIAGVTEKVSFNNATDLVEVDGQSFVDVYDAGQTALPSLPAGYRLKLADPNDKTKVLAFVDVLESTAKYNYTDSTTTDDLNDPNYLAPSPDLARPAVWSRNQQKTVTLTLQADGTYVLDPSISANGGARLAPGYRYHLVLEEDTQSISQPSRQTVAFTGAGQATPANKVQDDFTFTGSQKLVSGDKTWDQASHTYGKESVPVVIGYYADKAEAGGLTVTGDQPTVMDTVTYRQLGRIVPVDEAGQLISGAETPRYTNDPSDPTKVITSLVPQILGYTASLENLLPSNPGQDTLVVYIKDDQKATVIYRDETSGQELAQDHLSGKSGDLMTYSTADRVSYYQDRGYVLVAIDFPDVANFDKDKSVDQVFTVTLRQGTVVVGPNDPQQPGTAINPNDPNSPQWPAQEAYDKTVTATVHYVSTNQGASLPADKVQTARWTRTLTLNKVTGQTISATDWTADKATYDRVLSPVLTGYYVDKAFVVSKAVTQENLEETVSYSPLGRIIPVDANGNPLPNTGGLQYNNNPNDPTKASLTLVPEISGYKAEVVSVTPENPGQDTMVVYLPVTPEATVEEEAYIVIVYRDEAGNQIRMPRIISSAAGRTYDLEDEDRYINRNGVIYERIRQEGDIKGRVSKGRTTVTYIYRRVDDAPSQLSTTSTSRSSSVASETVSSNQTVEEGQTQNAQTASQQEQLPQTGDASNSLKTLGMGLLAILAGLGLYRPRKKQR